MTILVETLFRDEDDDDKVSSGDVDGSIGGKLDVIIVDADGEIVLVSELTVGGNGFGIGFSTGLVKPSWISCT